MPGSTRRMQARFDSYDSYEHSGVGWIGAQPSEWDTGKLRWLFKISSGDALSDEPEGNKYPLVGGNGVRGYVDRKNTQGPVIVVGRVGALCGNVHFFSSPIWATEHALRLIPRHPVSAKYCAYVLEAAQLGRLGGGTAQPVIAASKLANELIPVPPRPQQHKIAQFLDRRLTKINDLIDKKKRLIELLAERRTALITKAVTKGLDPDVPMKDSGVEWLGEIPEHWEQTKLRHLASVQRGASPRPIDDQKYFDPDGQYGWVRIRDVTNSGMYLRETEQTLSELGKSKSVPLKPGRVILSIAATVGEPIITDTHCCIHDGFVYFQQLSLEPEFLYFIFHCQGIYSGLGKLGTQLNLNTDTVGDIAVPVPPKSEQKRISAYLKRQVRHHEKMEAKLREAISTLHEYRSVLITAAVTGKIDVRDHAA